MHQVFGAFRRSHVTQVTAPAAPIHQIDYVATVSALSLFAPRPDGSYIIYLALLRPASQHQIVLFAAVCT